LIYLLAAIGALTIAVMLWRAFGPERVGVAARRPSMVAPDDDPDFLRQLGEQQRRKDDDGS
jgi:hypothetical protein